MGAAYESVTTIASSHRLQCFGSPVFGINRVNAVAYLYAYDLDWRLSKIF